MSKQRPSNSSGPPGAEKFRAGASSAASLWRKRVFKNTYTRGGRRLEVKNWSVKIQFQGMRQTFSLAARSRAEAGREARSIYETVVREGWQSALLMYKRRRELSAEQWNASYLERTMKMDLNYWKERLIFRRYPDPLKGGKEYSTRVDHEGTYHYFPLGTDQPEAAAARALEIYRATVSHGWERVCRRFSREFTVAIFWAACPLSCTYTTLYTFVGDESRAAAPPQAGARKLAIVEAEPELRLTLAYWLDRQPGFQVTAAYAGVKEALHGVKQRPPDLLLLNRALDEMHSLDFANQMKARHPNVPWFTFGVFQESDQIFISSTGVDAGYFLQRRLPTDLLEPLREALGKDKPIRAGGGLAPRAYFQNLFRAEDLGSEIPLSRLTFREKEILHLLSKGLLDKEIADNLGISPWTVHNHLKNIFEKLDAHTRTEAVVKYLQ